LIHFRSRLLCGVFLAGAFGTAYSQQPLVDKSKIEVSGTLTVERVGNHSFLMIRMEKPYLANFDDGDTRSVPEIGLMLEGRNSLLRKYVGRGVIVDGTVQLEASSPYYFNGTLIKATSVRLLSRGGRPSGNILTPFVADAGAGNSLSHDPRSPVVYHAEFTFFPKQSKFTYRAWDAEGNLLRSKFEYLTCALNGPGDVVNCFCAGGYAPTSQGEMRSTKFVVTERAEFEFAQFGIDQSLQHSVSKAVQCTRKDHISN